MPAFGEGAALATARNAALADALRTWHRREALLARCLLCALSLLVTSCSSVYQIVFHVSLADDVEAPGQVFLAFLIVEHGMTIENSSSRSHVSMTQGVRGYTGKGSMCCSPSPTIDLYAFIDLDGDRKLDFDEPRGADPNNPVQLTDMTTAYRSQIVLTLPSDP